VDRSAVKALPDERGWYAGPIAFRS
jgi:hypothetical protein